MVIRTPCAHAWPAEKRSMLSGRGNRVAKMATSDAPITIKKYANRRLRLSRPAGPQPVAPASKRSTSSGVTYRRCSSGSTSSAKRTRAGEHFNSPNQKPRPWPPNFTPGGFAHGSRGAEVLPGEVTASAEHCRRHGWVPPHYICGAHPALARQIGPILACRLPASRPRLDDDIARQGREPEYHIKSANEPHERVATESELSKA